MTTPHKATPEQWEDVEQFLTTLPYPSTASCLLELRDRLALLEATQHAHADASRMSDAEREQFYAELAKPARIEALKTAASAPADHLRGATEMVATDKALASFTAYFCRNYPGPDTIIHKPEWHAPRIFHAAADAIARWGRPTPEQSPAAPAPAGGLVERVADAMDGGTEAVILAVAEWLNKEAESHLGGGVYWSRRLREEVQRND